MATRLSTSRVVGLSWQQVPNENEFKTDDDDESDQSKKSESPTTTKTWSKPNALGTRILSTLNGVNNTGTIIQKSVFKSATSVKLALNSLKQVNYKSYINY